jgi:hypothetical protein
VSTHEVTAPVERAITIVHLSDLHSKGFGRRERRIVEVVEVVKPDLVAVTGDVVHDGNLENVRELFTRLKAPLGVFVVRGNWENWRPPGNEASFYASVGVRFLVNTGELARGDLWIAGVDDPMSGHADFGAALSSAPPGAAKIALLHSPEVFDTIQTDLALAGHTHGGQVRLPIVGSVWRPPGSGRFDRGWYGKLFVSQGIGTSLLPVRFLCRPEIAVIRVIPAITSR